MYIGQLRLEGVGFSCSSDQGVQWISQATFLFCNCVHAVCNRPRSAEVGLIFLVLANAFYRLGGGDTSFFLFILGQLEGGIFYSVEVGGGN